MRSRFQDFVQVAFFFFVVRPFLTIFIGLRVRGRENLPTQDRFLLIANHTSHLDTVSLLALFPPSMLRRIRPVAAADYFERNFVVSWLSRTLFNILPIVRKRELITPENDPRKKMRDALEAGDSLILFPEGTRRSTAEEVGRFKTGVASLVQSVPGLPVLPCFLVNMGRSLPKGEWIPVPFFCEVHIGAPRVLSGSSEEVVRSLESAVSSLKPS